MLHNISLERYQVLLGKFQELFSSCRLWNNINDIRKRNPCFVFFFRLTEFTSTLEITLMLKEINVSLFTLFIDFLDLLDVRFTWINGCNIVARFENNTCWLRIFNDNSLFWLFNLVRVFFGCIFSLDLVNVVSRYSRQLHGTLHFL